MSQQVVIFHCPGVFVAALACIQLLKNHSIVECEPDRSCFAEALLRLLTAFFQHQLEILPDVARIFGPAAVPEVLFKGRNAF